MEVRYFSWVVGWEIACLCSILVDLEAQDCYLVQRKRYSEAIHHLDFPIDGWLVVMMTPSLFTSFNLTFQAGSLA